MMLRRVTRYFFVGGIAAVVDIGFFFVFAKLAGLDYLAVATVGFIIATFINYQLSVRLAFVSGIRFTRAQEIFLVYLASAVGLVVNLAVLFVMVSELQAELIVSKVTATASVFFWNFVARNNFIFRQPAADKYPDA